MLILFIIFRVRSVVNGKGNSAYDVNSQSVSAPDGWADDPHAYSLIYDRFGNRKYLTADERRCFLHVWWQQCSPSFEPSAELSLTLARVSEALALTPARIDAVARLAIVESLKKRRRGIFRAIPIPVPLLDELEHIHHLAHLRGSPDLISGRLWPWCRAFAWRRIKEAMAIAGIDGPQATPKGLRHAFAVTALQGGVPITMVKRWLGLARLSTTETYADAIGPEEQAIAGFLRNTF